MSTISIAIRSFKFLLISFVLLTAFFGSTTLGRGLQIEPNHDKPCIVGDAWAEECMSCICLEGKIAVCKPSFCAARLKRDLDSCKEGEITRKDCNICRCKNNVRVCSKKDCDKRTERRAARRQDRKVRRTNRLNVL